MTNTITEPKNKGKFEKIKNVPYPLPEGWKWVRLEKVLKKEPQYGYTASATSKNTGIKFLRITDIQNNNVVWEKVPCVEIDNNTLLEKYKIAINDFVFARTGSTTGKTYRISSLPEENYVIFASYLIRITPVLEKVEPRFLEYFFLSNEYWKQIITKGSSKPNFNAKKLKQILIPLPFKNNQPDLEKQKQIVEKIETIFKEIDKAIALRQKALEDTKKLFESVLNKIFKEAEEDKDNWKWVRLGEVVSTIKGKKPKKLIKENLENYLPYLTADYFREKTLRQFSLPETNLKLIQENDLVMIWDGSKSGDIFISDIKGILASTMVKLIFKQENLFYRYLFYILKNYFEELNNNTTGSGIPHVSKDVFNNLLIPLPFKNNQPDLEKQKQIAEYLDNLHNKIKQLEELQKIQIEKFKQLKESILNKAFIGELI